MHANTSICRCLSLTGRDVAVTEVVLLKAVFTEVGHVQHLKVFTESLQAPQRLG